MDMYWGVELYPRVAGIDLKVFIICRLGIMLWLLFAVSFAFKSVEFTQGAPGVLLSFPKEQIVSVTLMGIYISKFFYWERWYLHAADIQVE